MEKIQQVSRRDFLKTGATVSAAAAAAGVPRPGYVAEAAPLKIGLIGCGGRGTGAVRDALRAAEIANVPMQLVAIADVFQDPVDAARKRFMESGGPELRDRIKLTPETCFTGLDCHEKLLKSEANYIILATPPGFRPMHFEAAVNAKKNIFCEKPVGTDAVGIRRFMTAAKKSEDMRLSVVAGTQRRHTVAFIETIKKIHDGQIGDILAARCYDCRGPVFKAKVRDPKWSDLEWQIRAWYSYIWLSGDQIVEQAIHSIDAMNWALGGHPVAAFASGGRAWKTKDQEYMGNIWDNVSVDYEYEIGGRIVHMTALTRHWQNCDGNVSEIVVGTKRETDCRDNLGQPLKDEGESGNVQEHVDLINSITGKGRYYNEAIQVAESSFTAILGRESAYSGKRLTWDALLNSELDLVPKPLSFEAKLPAPEIPVPGVYQIPGLAAGEKRSGARKARAKA
ncbi:MAG: Gfo/Idh/MocA family oxidoreductase [Candidatus Sumerlaeia bacterium]|nr:Gfo/Idh/MocA family oxidoreductase [Candidatus Sumerlaeia bacterium]